jgi:hypothetical protein
MHYMEATRAFMISEEYSLAFQCLQLAVQARTHPKIKHKFDDPHAAPFTVTGAIGITVMDSEQQPQQQLLLPAAMQQQRQQEQPNVSPPPAKAPGSPAQPLVSGSSSRSSPAYAALFSVTSPGGGGGSGSGTGSSGRSPALTSAAGTISADGKSLFLSPETMYPPISSREGRSESQIGDNRARSISIQPHPSPSQPSSSSSSFVSFASSSSSNAAAPTPSSTSASRAFSSSPVPPSSQMDSLQVPSAAVAAACRQRRHSLSGSANSANVTIEGVVHAVLHLDLLLARLAVQLAADLWVHLDFRDAILCLEIASSIFATLLIAERQYGTFRRRRFNPSALLVQPLTPLLPSHPLQRAESATSPNTPTHGSKPSPPGAVAQLEADSKTLAIQERLAGLLGPSAFLPGASSQTLGTLTLSSRPIVSKPVPKLLAAQSAYNLFDGELDKSNLVLHASDPHASVGEGEGFLGDDDDPGTTILEESLVCRMQLASYYITYDEELDGDRSVENQELRRSKALFEQVASQKPDQCLLHANLLPCLAESLSASLSPPHTYPRHVSDLATLIVEYAADDDKLHMCLFYAGLCDALIGIRVYQAAVAKTTNQHKVTNTASANSFAAKKAAAAAAASPKGSIVARAPPPIPDLYMQMRPVFCPPILLRYRDMCESFGETAEIRLLRSCLGLLQMAANLSQRLSDAFGPSAPRVAKQLFQAAWGAEIIREFTAVVDVFTKQRPLTNIAAKLLLQIKKQIKVVITL